MTNKILIFFSILIAIISVLISIIKGNEYTICIKPFFTVALFSIYSLSTKRINLLLLTCLFSITLGEMVASQDFEQYFNYIILCYVLFFSLGTLLIWPALVKIQIQHNKIDLVGAFIGGGLFLYLVASVFFISADILQEYIPLAVGTLSFSIFISSCFYISGYYKQRSSIYLFIVGVGYMIACLGGLVFELIMPSKIFLVLVNVSEFIAQFCFVYFLINLSKIHIRKKWLI